MKPGTSFSYKLTPEQQESLLLVLSTGNYMPASVPHTQIAVKTPGYCVNLYNSGKLLVQGKEAEEFVTFVLEPVVLQRVGVGYEEELSPESFTPHMGIDESGKGDFFGPLVIASAYVDGDLVRTMQSMGVRDSKNIKSDKKAMGLGRDIRALLKGRFSVVRIGPAAYNRLYAKMRNVNRILGWGHARAIENLLERVPDCPRAISDQFGTKAQVSKALLAKGRKIALEQRPRAEEDMAVAAASILAREAFLFALRKMKADYGIEPRKGASDLVREAAVEMVQRHGPDVLLQTAKCHFGTTDKVLAAVGASRGDLPPEGQAVSRLARPGARKRG